MPANKFRVLFDSAKARAQARSQARAELDARLAHINAQHPDDLSDLPATVNKVQLLHAAFSDAVGDLDPSVDGDLIALGERIADLAAGGK